LIVAAAADGGRIVRPLDCEDTRLLAAALEQAGWPVDWGEEIIVGRRRAVAAAEVDLGNSGTGSRLIVGLLACVSGRFRIDGTPRLRQRPMRPLLDALADLGAEISSDGGFLPVVVAGRRIGGGSIRIRPEVSSQFVSSLLLAGPLMQDGVRVEVLGPLPSRPYLELTRDMLRTFGAVVSIEGPTIWRVAAGGLRPTTCEIEGDWSAVAFAAAAVAVAGGRVSVGPVSPSSAQGDRAVCEILQRAGVDVRYTDHEVIFEGPANRPFEADLTATPDLFPALAVVAAAGPTGTRLSGLDHLKHKESDRLAVMIDNLGRLGAAFDRSASSISVRSPIRPSGSKGTPVTAANDHRVAMAMAVAGLVAGPLELDDDACVVKSFPGFWGMWRRLVESGSEQA
jgi:3-phosphoshikimate 1-carboxyvinyltransferase